MALIDFPVPDGVTLYLYEREGQSGHYAHLDLIKVDKDLQRSGLGTQVMNDIIAWADGKGMIVALTPGNDYGSPKTFLTRWYRSFGFIPNTGRRADNSVSGALIRYPNPSKGQ